MAIPTLSMQRIGTEGEPLVTIEGLAPDPEELRAAAASASFTQAGEHYPGLRAGLPAGYLAARMPLIGQAIGRAFGRCRRVHVVDASFSLVTTAPAQLSVRQRLPHVDAFGPERIALIHYLSPADTDGTAFYRHRATGFETVDAERAPHFFERLESELAEDAPPPVYIAGNTPQFERTALAEAMFNRALLYRSFVLHSGDISPDAALSSDPLVGRLTITAFFAVE